MHDVHALVHIRTADSAFAGPGKAGGRKVRSEWIPISGQNFRGCLGRLPNSLWHLPQMHGAPFHALRVAAGACSHFQCEDEVCLAHKHDPIPEGRSLHASLEGGNVRQPQHSCALLLQLKRQ